MSVDRAEALNYLAATEALLEELADLQELAQVEEVFTEIGMEMPPDMKGWLLALEFLDSTTSDALENEDFERVLESCRITRMMLAMLWRCYGNPR